MVEMRVENGVDIPFYPKIYFCLIYAHWRRNLNFIVENTQNSWTLYKKQPAEFRGLVYSSQNAGFEVEPLHLKYIFVWFTLIDEEIVKKHIRWKCWQTSISWRIYHPPEFRRLLFIQNIDDESLDKTSILWRIYQPAEFRRLLFIQNIYEEVYFLCCCQNVMLSPFSKRC